MPGRSVQVFADARFLEHVAPEGHPEREARLGAVEEALAPKRDHFDLRTPRAASPEELRSVHGERLLRALESTRGSEGGRLDADTYYGGRSFDVARLAAGASIDLVVDALRDVTPRGFAAVRPPGHHAEADRAMGFCLLNNVAIAARVARRELGDPRILIFDWDVHHGNGTQHVFEEDPEVFYVSTHQFPFYPGTGDHREAGHGRGLGATLNVPMPAGCGDAEYAGVVERILTPAALAFRPDLIVVSCGFDAHGDDPLASMDVSRAGYRAMAMRLRALADELCNGRIVYVLEGGYSLLGVREGTHAVLESLVAETADTSRDATEQSARRPPAPLEPGSTLSGLVERAVLVHGARIPDLGAA